MESKHDFVNVPFIVHEAEMSRADRYIRELWIALIIAILLITVSNIAWLIYISQYDFESYEVEADNDGIANYIGNDGDIYNGGESVSKKEEAEKP